MPVEIAAENRRYREDHEQIHFLTLLEVYGANGIQRHERHDRADRVLIDERGNDEAQSARMAPCSRNCLRDVSKRLPPVDRTAAWRGIVIAAEKEQRQ